MIRDILLDDDEDFLQVPDKFKDQIRKFERSLAAQKLSEKTVRKHVDNIDFYLHDYGVNYEQIQELKDGCYVISYYLGDWYIDKCAWVSKSDCKSQAASIKKFYKFMLEQELIEKEDYQHLVNEIKEKQEEWFERIERYDAWLMGDDDDDYDWYGG